MFFNKKEHQSHDNIVAEKAKYIREHYSVEGGQCCVVEYYRLLSPSGDTAPLGIGIIPKCANVTSGELSGFSSTDKLFIVESYSGFLNNVLLEEEDIPLRYLLVKPV